MKLLLCILPMLCSCQFSSNDPTHRVEDPITAKIEKFIHSDADSTNVRQRISQLQQSKAKVLNNKLNGSVFQVQNYIQSELFNPDSYESLEWGQVVERDSLYYVSHSYSVKDFTGTKIIYHRVFCIDLMGDVVGYTDCE